ncbi:MAG: ATP-binding protein [Planctomycetales bacterium]
MKLAIRVQLLVPLLTMLVTAVAALTLLSVWLNLSRAVSILQERQAQVARVVEHASFPLTGQVLKHMAELSGQQFVVWDSERREAVGASLEEIPPDLTEMLQQASLWVADSDPARSWAWHAEEYSLRITRQSRQPRMIVAVLTPRRSLFQARRDAVWPPLAVGGGTLLVLVPWLWALTRNWSGRIQQIQQFVAQVAAGQPARQPRASRHDDELSELVADLVRMHQRLGELQQELLQTERERLAAQLAAGLAHQLRNGVTGISLALQVHRARCPVAEDQSLAVAQRQIQLLEAELRGTLSLARRTDSPRDAVPLGELFQEVTELLSSAVAHQQIHLEFDPPSGGCSIDGSRDGLRAALLNLLLNAIDAAGPGGKIRLESRAAGQGVAIAVSDNGPGPAEEIAGRMMEPFVTTKPEGVGLGLTVVAAVAQYHGGRLEVRRDDGWTIIELHLPWTVSSKRVPA